jgi:hypothetical protein
MGWSQMHILGTVRMRRLLKQPDDDAVAVAGCISRSEDDERCAEMLGRMAVERLASVMVTEKVCYRVLDFLDHELPDLGRSVRAVPAMVSRMRRLAAVAARQDELIARIASDAAHRGIAVWGIKGVAARGWYRQPELRDVGDIDLMVSDIDGAYALAATLRQQGYGYDPSELPWIKAKFDGRDLYGQVNLWHPDRGQWPNVDIHFGGYSVRHCEVLPLPAPVETGYRSVDQQTNLPYMVANAAGDHRISVKDLNDLYLCLASGDVDWARVSKQLEAALLGAFFRRMLGRLRHLFHLHPGEVELVDWLSGRGGLEWPSPDGRWTWQRRFVATVGHATRSGSRHGLAQALVRGTTAVRSYWGHPRIEIQNRRRGPVPSMPALNQWTCVRLVPVEQAVSACQEAFATVTDGGAGVPSVVEELGGGLAVVKTPGGDVVRAADTVFVPTVDYALDIRTIAAASAVADQRR